MMVANPIVVGFLFVVMSVLVIGFGASPRTAAIIAAISFFPAMYLFGLWRMRRRERADDFQRRKRFQ
jgi:lipopolysaccharide export LptBFGC system permease protein LptF